MGKRLTYEELEQRVEELEKEAVERRSLEEKLKEREATLRALLNAPTETAILADLDGKILALNEIAAQRLGKSEDELIGLGIFDHLPPDLATTRKAKGEEAISSGKPVRFEDARVGRLYDNNIYPVFDISGRVKAFAVYSRDITEHKKAENALRESEEKYRTLLETLPDIVYSMRIFRSDISPEEKEKILGCIEEIRRSNKDALDQVITRLADQLTPFIDGTILYANEIASTILGYSLDRLGTINMAEIVAPEHLDLALRDTLKILSGHRISGLEYELVTAAGDRIFARVSINLAQGEFPYVIQGVARDITERKHAEETLKESEALLRKTQNMANLGTWRLDLEKNDLYWSDEVYRIFGLVPQEFGATYEAFLNAVHPDDREKVHTAYTEAINTNKSYEIIHRVLRPDGTVRIVHEKSEDIKDESGKTVFSIGMVHDITERKQAEEALKRERDRSQQYLDIANVMFIAIDVDQNVMMVNRKGCEILGYEEHEIIGRNWFEHFIKVDDIEEVKEVFAQVISGNIKQVEYFENSVLKKDGDERIIAWHNSVIKDESGHIIGTLSSGVDITEGKKAGEALRESEEKFRSLVESSSDHIFLLDRSGKYLFSNNRVHQFGIEHQDFLVGRHVEDTYAPDVAEVYQGKLKEVLNTGKAVQFEHVMPQSDGQCYHLDTLFPIYRDKEIWAVGGICRDITERKQAEEALRESEKFLENIFDAIQDGLSILDPDLNIVRVNSWMENMYSQEAPLAGKKCYRAYQNRDTPCPWCPTLKTLETGETHSSIVPYPSEENPTGWIDLTAFPLKDDNGNVRGVIEYVKDITRQKQAEDELRRSEERYRFLYNRTPIMLHSIDREGYLISVNEYWLETLGYDLDEVIGKKSIDFLTEESRIFAEQSILPMFFKEGFVKKAPYQMVKKNREVIDVLISANSERDDQNQVLGSLAVIEDITERKQAEEVLKREKEKFRVLVEESPLGVSLIGKDGRYAYINPKFTQLFGYSLQDIPTGKDWFVKAYPDPEYRKMVISIWMDDLERSQIGESRPREFKVICKDSTEKAIYFRPVALEDGDQLVIYEDVTGKKALEAKLQHAQKMEAIGTLAGGIAHDFNNILGAIIGYADLAIDGVSKSDSMHYFLEQILQAGYRARDLVKQILLFSRPEEEEVKPFRLGPLVKEATKLLRATLPATIEIRADISALADTVLCDPGQMYQVIMNLCTNAAYAMREKGGVLGISLVEMELDSQQIKTLPNLKEGPYLRLQVSDTGQGIAPDDLNNIFDPFFTTKQREEGTGLGLAVVHGIVKNHGGAIAVDSEPGQGTAFDIFLPIVEAGPENQMKGHSAPIPKGKECVLFVDDEPSLIEIGREMLERFGYKVVTMMDSVEALEAFRSAPQKFDIVITDYTMPKMTGAQLANELMRIRPDIPIILCTGFSEQIDAEEAKRIGIREFIFKPLVVREMAEAVRRVLDHVK